MTISTTTRTRQYNGDNSTTVFAYNFNIQADSELEIYLGTPVGAPTSWAQQTLTTDFSVSGAGTAGGGDVTFVTAPPTGTGNVYIRRVTAKTQTSDYVENDPFTAATLENNFDKLTQVTQDMQEEIDRCFKLGSIVPDAGTTEASSVVADRASKLFAFDASGDFSVTQEIGTHTGDWAASTAYVVRDLIKDTSNNNIYICLTAHTSSGSQPISSNADVAKWSLIVDAASASTSATAAAASATTATTKATAAASSATAAASSASAGATSATASASSATAAASSATAAAASADSFDDLYLGAKSSDPSVDNDGDALTTGDIYFNTSSNNLRVWNGSAWQVAAVSTSGLLTEISEDTSPQLGASLDVQGHGVTSSSSIMHPSLTSTGKALVMGF